VTFADMAAVRVTPAADGSGGTARVEAGARWREVIDAAQPHGLAPLAWLRRHGRRRRLHARRWHRLDGASVRCGGR
jgi:hypothetical protein